MSRELVPANPPEDEKRAEAYAAIGAGVSDLHKLHEAERSQMRARIHEQTVEIEALKSQVTHLAAIAESHAAEQDDEIDRLKAEIDRLKGVIERQQEGYAEQSRNTEQIRAERDLHHDDKSRALAGLDASIAALVHTRREILSRRMPKPMARADLDEEQQESLKAGLSQILARAEGTESSVIDYTGRQ